MGNDPSFSGLEGIVVNWQIGMRVQYKEHSYSYGVVTKVEKNKIFVQWLDDRYRDVPESIYRIDDIGDTVIVLTPVMEALYDFK